jgi:hypothetical protein
VQNFKFLQHNTVRKNDQDEDHDKIAMCGISTILALLDDALQLIPFFIPWVAAKQLRAAKLSMVT